MRVHVIATALALLIPLVPAAASEDLAPARSPDAVAVHRGSAIAPGYLSTPASVAAPETESVGGRQIWFVDRANDRLVNCRAWNTTVIGQRRIICTPSRRLPD
jgi:hypothetical protein